MRSSLAALTVATLIVSFAAPVAQAAPTQVNVRIEGKSKTLFEGPVLTDVHRVKAATDSQWRRCNGINVNVPANKVPGVVPTSAAADAMRILGETFSGQWYNQWEDYFVTRWGPDEQNLVAGEQWGIVVNNVFTDVGGCQYQLDGGDEVLSVYDAFDGRPRLSLYPAGYSGGAVPGTATATLNQPFEVEVDSWSTYNEGKPPAAPTRSSTPYAGAEVAPVTTGAKGFQQVEAGSPKTVVTGADGKATIVFTEPGWHRIKAADVVADTEIAVRSNRLDVCVPDPPATGCVAPPADAQLRTPPPPVAGELEEGGGGQGPKGGQPGGGGQAGSGGQGAAPATGPAPADARPVQLELPRLDRSRLARGLVGVSWRVLDPGVGIAGWSISSKALGRKGTRYVERASGADRTAATLRLPRGTTHRLQLTVTDVLGRASSAPIGKVRVPR